MIDDEEMTGTGPIYDVAAARWGIAYHSSNSTPRSKRWYRVSRMVYADGGWFELYWHAEVSLRGDNLKELQRKARNYGLDLLPGLFHDMRASTCRRGGEMARTL
jgi:hypothetical protein